MDRRSIEWLHLLPAHGELIVGQAPAAFSALLEQDLTFVSGNGPAYVGWRSGLADIPDPGQYESIVLVNPRRVTASALENAGFSHTRAFTALPSVADTRWLVPLGNARVSASSLRLADPWRFRDRTKRRILSGAARLGQLPRFGDVLLLARNSKSDLEKTLEERLDCPEVFLALKTGPPRTMRKTTVQVMRHDGSILAYAKLATSPDARAVVRREIDVLLEFNRHNELAGAVPRMLGTIETDGYFASILAAGPGRRGPATFGAPHRRFLQAMESATGRNMIFRSSDMWQNMGSKFETLGPQLSSSWRSRLAASLRKLADVLGSRELLMSTAHRDFGPWNTRLNVDGSLFVFDWDGARQEIVPLYDMFGFHFLDFGNLVRPGSHVDIPEQIFNACRKWAPDVNAALTPYYFLAYLTESALGRLVGALWRSEVESDPILRSVALLLDSQSDWLPSEPLSVDA